jgi:predicted RND superfamily exporter protein
MKSISGTWFARSLEWLASVVLTHRRLFFWPQVVLFVLGIFYTVRYLEFDISRDNLVGAKKKYHQNFLALKKEFPEQDDLVVAVESENAEKNRQFVERLGARLEAETNLFKDVFYKGDLKMLGNKALLFVPETDLVELQKTLGAYRPFINQFTQATNLVTLFEQVNTQFRTAKRQADAETESLVKALPALERIITQARSCLHRPGTPPSPGLNALLGSSEEAEQSIYITFNKGRIYVITAHAPCSDKNADAVDALRKFVAETKTEVPGINVGVTGEPILEIDEMAQSQHDSTISGILSFIICALIFIYGYSETGRPVKAVICLLVGISYTMAFTTAVVGHLNILTITFVPILIGLAIDFGVHLVTRYEEELRHGHSEEEALKKAMVYTGQGIFTGAFTTAGAFLAMGFTNFKGIQEMGIICGGGLLICLIPMMTLLPVLLLRGKQNRIDHDRGDAIDHRARIESLWLRRPALVAGITITLCVLAFTQFPKVFFDYNLLNMQSKGLPAVEFERKLIASAGKSVLYGAVVADSLEEAQAIEEKLKGLTNVVSSVESMTRFLAENPRQKLEIIGQIKQDVSSMQFAGMDRGPVAVGDLTRTLWSLAGYCGLAADMARAEDPAIADQLISLRDSITYLRKDMLALAPEATSAKLAAFQQALFSDIHNTFRALAMQDNSGRMRIEDLPVALRNRFIGVTGKYLIQVFPKEDVWKRENQQVFIHTLRSTLLPHFVDEPHRFGIVEQFEKLWNRVTGRPPEAEAPLEKPIITGTPIQLYEYTQLLRRSYEEAALYALGAIVILVLLHFRSPVSVLLSLLPVVIGSIWLGGIMGWCGIPLNPANIMTLPLVIGVGVTNGIHILNRFAEERNPGILAKSTGKAVLVSGLTTIAGFGSLVVAKHQGIESLGWVMATGTATCMIAGLTFLPALLTLMMRWRKE